jgi:hypothetical protein
MTSEANLIMPSRATTAPACTLSLRLPGVDVVFEGDAHRVIDSERLAQVAAVFRAGGWPADVDGDALTAPYSAQSASPLPWPPVSLHGAHRVRRGATGTSRRQPVALLSEQRKMPDAIPQPKARPRSQSPRALLFASSATGAMVGRWPLRPSTWSSAFP